MVNNVGDLPDDVLADVLRRLPPRNLALCRRVCRAWRDAVDARRLLRADLLPLSVGGIFLQYCQLYRPEFFRRPSARGTPPISASLDFMPSVRRVLNHCNGLLLCEWYDHVLYVANPATRRWAQLPRRPASGSGEAFDAQSACLVYDPTVSPHYEVFSIPILPDDIEMLQSELPPSSYALQVFSSQTGRWEERMFAREGGAASVIGDTRRRQLWTYHGAVYWRGALYFCHKDDSFMRVFTSNSKYKLVQLPTDVEFNHYGNFHLGRSKKGVYCAFTHDWHGLWIFFLNESYGQTKWVLKHRVDFKTFARKLHARKGNDQPVTGSWVLQNINKNDDTALVEEKYKWNSDDDDVLNTKDMVEGNYDGSTCLLGFHPYKEVVFLDASLRRGVAYHWNTCKFQDLGNLFPTNYAEIAGPFVEIEASFVYTPCWMEDFPEAKWDTQIEN
ncbi:hypothetical protein EJB05_06514, partial [Eragrostis curvula]